MSAGMGPAIPMLWSARRSRWRRGSPHSRSGTTDMLPLRSHALQIWHAAVDAARPYAAIRAALTDPHHTLAGVLASARRILVAGAGKAGLAMSQAVEETLGAAL